MRSNHGLQRINSNPMLQRGGSSKRTYDNNDSVTHTHTAMAPERLGRLDSAR
jgi:hypothetical protein